MRHSVYEFFKGCTIDFRQLNPRLPNYGKFIRSTVYGVSTDENGVDVLEIGKHGEYGYVDVSDVSGVEITEKIIEKLGFIRTSINQDCITYYREDLGYIKLSTYGVEHLYWKGGSIKYLHTLERVVFDFKGVKLKYIKSSLPKQEFVSKLIKHKEFDASEALKKLDELNKQLQSDSESDSQISFEF